MTNENDDTNEALRVESRLARLEAQALAHSEQLDALLEQESVRKRRGLILRLAVLVAMLGVLFYLKARG